MSNDTENKWPQTAKQGSSGRDVFFTPMGWAQSVKSQAQQSAMVRGHEPSGQWAICQTTDSEGELIVQSGDDVYVIYVAKGEDIADVCMKVRLHDLLQNRIAPNSLTLYQTHFSETIYNQSLPMTLLDSQRKDIGNQENIAEWLNFTKTTIKRGSFLPSDQLAQLWKNGLLKYSIQHGSGSKIRSELKNETMVDVRNQFSIKLLKMFAALGSITQHKEADLRLIATDNEFSLEVQHEILNRFYVSPSQHSRFLYMLLIELKHFLRYGGSVEGRWGRLAIDGSDIRLDVEPFISRATGRTNAKVVE